VTTEAQPLTAAIVSERLAEKFGPAVLEQTSFRGEQSTHIAKTELLNAITFLRDELGFNHLSDVTSADYVERKPRFDVIYHLFSFETYVWYRLRVRVEDGEPVPTCVDLFPCANWAEREVWDLMGIPFEGHPNLVRIMLPEGWVGHPLRKDYPMSQITLPRSGAVKMPES
jgi:NADH-quinone oxidoreductase subunit C